MYCMYCPCLLQIKVKRRGDDQKFLARVLALGVDCDIALLTGEVISLRAACCCLASMCPGGAASYAPSHTHEHER